MKTIKVKFEYGGRRYFVTCRLTRKGYLWKLANHKCNENLTLDFLDGNLYIYDCFSNVEIRLDSDCNAIRNVVLWTTNCILAALGEFENYEGEIS